MFRLSMYTNFSFLLLARRLDFASNTNLLPIYLFLFLHLAYNPYDPVKSGHDELGVKCPLEFLQV